MTDLQPISIPDEAKERVRTLFMAKHALWGGGMHPEDGNHAIYHHEVRVSLEKLGLNLEFADSYDVLFSRPEVDFVFPLLNRGGFVNSEMLIPTLCNMHRIPYLGAMPFLRGLGDDKSVSKLVCKHAGVPTAAWFCYRKGGPVLESDLPASREGRWVIKPNASSASWGISDAFDWAGVANAIADIHGQGHDAIVEPYLDGYDVQCAFITINNDPIALPMLWYEREDTQRLWTYYEKRDLVQNTEKAALKRFDDSDLAPKIEEMATKVAQEFVPFDYGRIEFRLDLKTGAINFIEINLNCNLWSEKVMAKAAAQAGFSHGELLETLLAEAWRRNGLTN
ncbi:MULTISPECIES: phosphoribosylglycinamide synthetase [unclassified Erythrobacter]|uniref:D-alanine--D-alanine ligase family protein n=1 Tax=unclassified Erythrobacter TaxID=2633097 RepID=UPI00076D3B27|nr:MULTISPECIES: phosphoribosylglycinamide synthetase [unclassified Erythrobacter]KWV95659.1 phosphoribosylglycinamide synthetase [Erythrobacter sp. AP23]MBO6525550.1 phosphoribosylglycinamide synthetase [Erythrobacter sp.]MBO6529777.1 phosphoribosylglycinamide synthetase [Erythrobacter sp.]MBO6766786.1 phosphoribosylglycinamide synthetase [Erythrobacter sp.]